MASKMRVTSLIDEARCYQALPITAKSIGHRPGWKSKLPERGSFFTGSKLRSEPRSTCFCDNSRRPARQMPGSRAGGLGEGSGLRSRTLYRACDLLFEHVRGV